MVARAAGGGADGLHVGAGVRLGQTEAAPHLAAGEAGQEAAALGLGAVVEHDQRQHGVAVDHPGQRHPAPAQLLDDARVGEDVQPQSAVGGRDEGAEQPELGQARDQRVRVGVGVLQRGGDGPHLGLHEAADRAHDRRGHGDADSTTTFVAGGHASGPRQDGSAGAVQEADDRDRRRRSRGQARRRRKLKRRSSSCWSGFGVNST